MDPKVTDIHQTLVYHSRRMNRQFLMYGVVLLFLGAFVLYVFPPSTGTHDSFMLAFTLSLGGGMTIYALFRTFVPGKPALVISSDGLRLRAHVEWSKDIVIPWRAVKDVDSADITGWFRRYPVRYQGVTVVLVTRAFYDRHIHVNSWVLRGPSWDSYFIPAGEMVQVALHHLPLSVSAEELRAAIEARWRAFGGAGREAR